MVAAHSVSTSSTHQRHIAATPKKRPPPTTTSSVATAKMEQGNAFVRANKRSKVAGGAAGANGKAMSTPGKGAAAAAAAVAATATIPGAGSGGAGAASTGGAAYTRGMFLAFVDNALQERRMVSSVFGFYATVKLHIGR